MNPVHIIQGSPKQFAAAANEIITTSEVSLRLRCVTCAGGVLAGVLESSGGQSNAPGALVEVMVTEVNDPAKAVAGLVAENPFWSVASVFAKAGASAKAGGNAPASHTILVAVLCQP